MSIDDDSSRASGGSGQAGRWRVDRPRKWSSRRMRWSLLGAVVMLTVTAVVLSVVLRAPEPDEASVPLPDASTAWSNIAAEVSLDPARRYSDEELGLYELVDKVVFYRPYFARARTADEAVEQYINIRDYQEFEAEGHERERLLFEFDVESALLVAYGDLPADLGEDGRLVRAYYEWMTHCVADAGFPDVVLDPDTQEEVPIYQAEYEQLDSYESATGFTLDEFYDLRFECARRATSFPTLEPGVRDGLVHRMRQHLLQAVHEYLREPDVIEIPVEHHEGDVHPLEDSYIERCLGLEVAERESCAAYYRVELTDEQKVAPVPERVLVDESGPYPLVGQPCGFSDAPGLVVVDREGNYCDMFENLEFVINYPETTESQDHVSNAFFGGPRLLICPDDWVIDDDDKCRYPRREEAAMREAFVAANPDQADVYGMGLYSMRYADKD